jgi:predicted porin
MNNKSRIALALAAAFGTAAMGASAQTSTVQIGGSFNMFYSITKPGSPLIGGTKHDNLSLSEPEMWIHGEEKIGGATVWFRCTSSFDLMGTGAANTTGAGQFCGRNSALGFKGNFGNIFAGTWDTPQKHVGNAVRGWWGGTASLTGGFAQVLYGGSGSNTGNTGGTFWERRSRLISYHSPSFSGFEFKAAYSAANEETALTTAASQVLSPRMLGASASYSNGPLYLGVGYEKHNDYNPGSVALGAGAAAYNGGSDTNWTFGGAYTFAFGTRLSGLYSRSKFDVTNTTELKKNGWAIFVDHRLSGPHSIKGQYFKGGDSKGTSAVAVGAHAAVGPNTGAKGWSLAYMYEFSKRTQAGFVYGLIDNDASAMYTKGVSTAAPGATQKVYGLNVRHRF